MLNLSISDRVWLTENILEWKHLHVWDVWITESETHQYLPNFEDEVMIFKLLEIITKRGYSVFIDTFPPPHINSEFWECKISDKNNYIISIANDVNMKKAIIKSVLRLKNND